MAVEAFRAALKEARKSMGWDQRSLATALRMSDKTIGHLESSGSPDLPAAQDVLDFMKAYGIDFAPDYLSIDLPAPEQRYFLTLDFRFEPKQEDWVRDIARRMRIVGMSVVRRFNRAKMTASSYDGVELHAPPINRPSLDAVLKEFLADVGLPVDCLVRNRQGLRLTAAQIPEFWNQASKTNSVSGPATP